MNAVWNVNVVGVQSIKQAKMGMGMARLTAEKAKT